uniref:Cyclin D binding myb-like transcription factor 1 n=1 Tax=Callorhinchus milii TaxID=7868 RepID=A0A4W3H5R3_CALMI
MLCAGSAVKRSDFVCFVGVRAILFGGRNLPCRLGHLMGIPCGALCVECEGLRGPGKVEYVFLTRFCCFLLFAHTHSHTPHTHTHSHATHALTHATHTHSHATHALTHATHTHTHMPRTHSHTPHTHTHSHATHGLTHALTCASHARHTHTLTRHTHSHAHTASTDSCAVSADCETITLNAGTLQRFEFLPSFRLQPTGTPGTYLIQTSSSQGLPITLTASPAVTLTSPSSPEQIIVHTLSPEALLHGTAENVSVQMNHPGVIIHAVESDGTSTSITQAELRVDPAIDPTGPAGVRHSYGEIDPDKLSEEGGEEEEEGERGAGRGDLPGAGGDLSGLKPDSIEVLGASVETSHPEICGEALHQDHEVHTDLDGAYVTEALCSPTMDVDEEATLIVTSEHGFIQSADDILPLTTLTDPLLQSQADCSIIDSSLESEEPED